jgi:hypothetical protein
MFQNLDHFHWFHTHIIGDNMDIIAYNQLKFKILISNMEHISQIFQIFTTDGHIFGFYATSVLCL